MTESEFEDLLKRYREGLCTHDEVELLEKWLDSKSEIAPEPFKSVTDRSKTEATLLNSLLGRIRSAKSLADSDKVQYTTSDEVRPLKESVSIGRYRTVYRIAASLLLIALVGYGAYLYKFQEPATDVVSDIAPGGDKAILQLADGTQIELDSTGSVVIPQQGTAQIINESGKLAYLSAVASAKEESSTEAGPATGTAEEILYNTITTPRGGQYQLTLADGSEVWLNAGSSLRFPAAFAGKERIVELTGEAYFEIVRNKNMPFKVRIPSGAEVEVLGTHFNVMAYEEEQTIRTTLLEGSVRIYSGSGAEVTSVRLEPNQQAQLTRNGNITIIRDYDVTEAVAWKNGTFIFNDMKLETIMRQVSRWYDVEVTYQDDLRGLEFWGVVSRREKASAVLNLLELTGEVDFEIRGREIQVKTVGK